MCEKEHKFQCAVCSASPMCGRSVGGMYLYSYLYGRSYTVFAPA